MAYLSVRGVASSTVSSVASDCETGQVGVPIVPFWMESRFLPLLFSVGVPIDEFWRSNATNEKITSLHTYLKVL